MITIIHIFGHNLKWNPHIHAIVTLGAFNKKYKFLHKKYFHVDSIAGQWKKWLLILLNLGIMTTLKLKIKLILLLTNFIVKI
ncbi:transposase [Fusobacterium varium]|uniref:transposase n=1 Tax=Fusobacterium varium TaxID=856 RepID=UPI0002FCFEFC